MKTNLIHRLSVAIIGLILMGNTTIAQQKTDDAVSHKTAEKWLKKGSWRSGLKLNPHASVNADEFYKQYHSNKAVWEKVISFLKNTDLDTLSPGKHAIDGENAYASVTEGPSKDLNKATWESHKKYIDLQYVIKGKEQIEVANVSAATVIKPYDSAKDVANYTAKGAFYVAEPGTFFLFFPQDAHRPNIKVNGYDTVKKLVIKIRVAG